MVVTQPPREDDLAHAARTGDASDVEVRLPGGWRVDRAFDSRLGTFMPQPTRREVDPSAGTVNASADRVQAILPSSRADAWEYPSIRERRDVR